MSPTTQGTAAAGGPDEPEDAVMSSSSAGADRRESDQARVERERREAQQMDSVLWSIVGHMAASLVVYGGLGYLLGRWLGHPILLLFGLLFGMVTSLVYTIWLANRAGREG
jgi:F0F1-type ATP synthase assembly protein I